MQEQQTFSKQQATLIEQQQNIINNTAQLSDSEVKQKIAKIQQQLIDTKTKLTLIQDKQFNLQASYQKEQQLRKISELALQQFKQELPAEKIKAAQISLGKGDKRAAEEAFDTVVNNHAGNIALAAFQSGQLAKDRIDYTKAIKQYTKAVALAELYRQQGAYTKAEPLYRRSLAIDEKALGKMHPSVAITLNNLAYLYHSQGAYAKAEPLYQRALLILKATFPQGHPNIEALEGNYAKLKRKKEP